MTNEDFSTDGRESINPREELKEAEKIMADGHKAFAADLAAVNHGPNPIIGKDFSGRPIYIQKVGQSMLEAYEDAVYGPNWRETPLKCDHYGKCRFVDGRCIVGFPGKEWGNENATDPNFIQESIARAWAEKNGYSLVRKEVSVSVADVDFREFINDYRVDFRMKDVASLDEVYEMYKDYLVVGGQTRLSKARVREHMKMFWRTHAEVTVDGKTDTHFVGFLI